jgi:hypothetical protein
MQCWKTVRYTGPMQYKEEEEVVVQLNMLGLKAF